MPEYLTPGVYYELLDTAAPEVRGVRTDIAAFVGLGPRGPLHQPVQILSWRHYQAVFGSFVSYGFLAYAVKGFFENGGQTCYIVRVAGHDAQSASLMLKSASGVDLVRIQALNQGTWGNSLKLTLVSVSRSRGSFSLSTTGPDGNRETYRDLTLRPNDPRNCVTLLKNGDDRLPPSRWISAELPDVLPDPNVVPDANASGLIAFNAFLAGGRDGLASLTRDDFLGTLDDPETGKRGLGSLERISQVAIVCMPDIHILPAIPPAKPDLPPPPPSDPCLPCGGAVTPVPIPPLPEVETPPRFSEADIQTMQRALIEHCELRGDRVAILDAPVHQFGSPYSTPEILDWRSRFDSERGFAALYYPWVKVLDPLKLGSPVRAVPPCGHIAGLYARTDLEIGVHKAPANGEAQWAEDVTVGIGDELQGVLNPEGVNCLRAFPGRGILVYGARTISSDGAWRYVSIRRLLIMIEKAVDLSTQWAVFEPHDLVLRQKLTQSISSFLESIWRRGMLAGATKDEAFYVKCDATNNPQGSVDAGRIITEIGVAPAAPAEFVVIRIGQTREELETVER
jgi:phage tail sheath protein FI